MEMDMTEKCCRAVTIKIEEFLGNGEGYPPLKLPNFGIPVQETPTIQGQILQALNELGDGFHL